MSGRVLGVVALGAVLVGVVALFAGGGGGGYRLKAEFRDVEGIRAGYWVRVDGARAGEVTDVKVTSRGTALVTMKLQKAEAPVGEGATVEIRPANLLGEKYIDLHRGDLRRPLASGTALPLSRASNAVELDDVLNMLAPDVRARLRIFINEAGVALAGHGANFNAMFNELPPSLVDARRVVAQLASENQQLGRLVDRADAAVGPVSERRDDVARTVDSTAALLRVTADDRRALAASVRSAPAALHQITTTLDGLDRSVQRLAPAVPLLHAAAPRLDATLRALPGFTAAIDEPLKTATETAPMLDRLGRQGAPAVHRLRSTVASLGGFVDELRPLVYAAGRAGGVEGALGILDNWQKASSYSDGLSHFFDFHVSIPERVMTSAVERLSAQASARRRARTVPLKLPTKSTVSDLLKQAVGRRGSAKEPLRPVTDALTRTPQQVVSSGTGAVKNLLDYLLK